MKYFLLLSLLSFSAFANHHEHGPMKDIDTLSLEDAKKKMMDHFAEKERMLAEKKACVQMAKTKDELKGCHKKMEHRHAKKDHAKKRPTPTKMP